MAYLIDGYNFLHALGRLTPRSGRTALEGARRWLLVQLRHGPEVSHDTTVVFDANTSPPGSRGRIDEGGISLLFARDQSADDLIEELIEAEDNPRSLTVVSDDRRIQHAGRRRGCRVLGCLDFHERCLQTPPPAQTPVLAEETNAKPDTPSPEETREWLDAFSKADDPLFRDPF